MKQKPTPPLDLTSWSSFSLVFLLVLLVWLSLSLFIQFSFANSPQHSGLLGDSYGLLNSLFSAFAFAGLFYTILLQKKELHETKLEFKEQNKTFKHQRFEDTFFNLVSLHSQTVSTLIFPRPVGHPDAFLGSPSPDGNKGRKFLQRYFDQMVNIFSKPEGRLGHYKMLYKMLYNAHAKDIESYFESLRIILSYVKYSDLVQRNDKVLYYSILSAQFSSYENLIIFYHLMYADLDQHGLGLKELVANTDFLRIRQSDMLHESQAGLLSELEEYKEIPEFDEDEED